MTDLLGAALDYARHGMPVFPLRPRSKVPATANGFKDATTDEATIRQWWADMPGANIGLPVPEGVVVVDIDNHKGASIDDLPPLYFRNGETTPVQRTRSGGLHVWFKAPAEEIHSRKDGLELRHGGKHYVVVEPSIVEQDGLTGKYKWVGDWRTDITQFPAEWVPFFTKSSSPKPEHTTLDTPRHTLDGESIADRYSAETSWRDILEPLGWRLVQGDGDTDGSFWRHPTATADWSASVRHGLLTCYSPNTPFEQDRSYTKFRALAVLRYGGDMSAAARALRVDYVKAIIGNAVYTWNEPALEAAQDDGPALPYVIWPELWHEDTTTRDWLVEPVLAAGRGHALFAAAGGGKSWVVLEIVAALATGRKTLQRPEGQPAHVLYLDYEMSPADLRDRLEGFGYDETTDLSHLHYVIIPDIDGLDTYRGGQIVLRAAREVQAELVVIDTTARAVEGEENNADVFRAFYRYTGAPLKREGIAWLRIDHAGKDVEKGQRGSSGKNDDVDVIWRVERRESGVRLEATKRRMPWVPHIVDLATVETDLGVAFTTGDKTYPTNTFHIVDKLDELGVSVDVGRPTVRNLLAEHGLKYRTEAIAAAIKFRKERARQTVPEGEIELVDRNAVESSGTLGDNTLSSGGTLLGTVGNSGWSDSEAVCVYPVGYTQPHADPLDTQETKNNDYEDTFL